MGAILKQQIFELVEKFIKQKRQGETYKPGEDWIQYSGPLFDSREFIASIDTLLDEWYIVGKKTREFEKTFPERLGKKYGVFVNSGSSANLLMVAAAKKLHSWKAGDKIITPVVAFPTTVNPIIQNGLEPEFVDIVMPNLNINLFEVERLLENDKKDGKIKAIMLAHVLGNPAEMDWLMEIVRKYKLVLLEDACDALGSTYDGGKLGSFGEFSTCSFFPAHHITSMEGGFVAMDSNVARALVTSLRDWGRACFCSSKSPGNVTSTPACKNRFRKWLPGQPDVVYDHRYVFSNIGYNLKPTEMQAAIILEQMKKQQGFENARKKNHARLLSIFEDCGADTHLYLPYVSDKRASPSWFAFLVAIRDGAPFSRIELVQHLENHKIQTRSYFSGNILSHPAYREYAKKYKDIHKTFPMASKSTRDSFFLGVYPGLTDQKLDHMEFAIREFFKQWN